MKKIDADELKKKFKKHWKNTIYSMLCDIIDSMPDLSKPKRQKEITVEVDGHKVKFWFEPSELHNEWWLHSRRNKNTQGSTANYYFGDEAEALAEALGLELLE